MQHPFIVTSEFGWLDKWPSVTADEYLTMRMKNKKALQDEKKIIVYADGHAELQKQKQVKLMTRDDLDRIIDEQNNHGSPTEDEPIQPQKEYDPSKPTPWKRK